MTHNSSSLILGVSQGVTLEPVDPEAAELHAGLRRGPLLAIDGHLSQDPPHRRRHLEPVP